ncbi:capsular biosynthesis protein [Aquibium carbonis]|uniref:protein-tyrosine-phosphatase n=1 Tax=Aquibium carbonis TaxID=2495581 RepID=A0A3S0A8I7_9HYPH|nr:CpsB/CapC family capsule biosynthesis tyrosine phosphatase [Aquibium carbonis]RST87108.1 capsular biosynthesis protein [Aquibium carbonis]
MIDIHSHILPGLDDGAPDLATSIQMARLAVADGITCMACTPHILPGLYENTASGITVAIGALRKAFADEDIPLEIVTGADVHVAPDLVEKLNAGLVPTLNGSRYFLFEPSHRILTPRLEEFAERLIGAGFIPIVTHPERLQWIRSSYGVIQSLNRIGCLMQITAGSVLGEFGKVPLYFAERLLDEGRVDILASDAHGTTRRRPLLSRARDAVAQRLGEAEANAMVETRPAAVLCNATIAPVGQFSEARVPEPERRSFLSRLFGRTNS